MEGVVISPMGIGEVLDTGFNLARRHYRWLVVVTAWGAVPSYVLFALADILFASATGPDATTAASVLGGGFAMLLHYLGVTLTAAALIIGCGRVIAPTGSPDEYTAMELYREATGRLFATLRLGILYVVSAFPLTILLPVGIYLWVRWSVAWVAILLEGAGARASLGRSWRLTRGAWWHTLVVIFGSSLIVSILTVMAGGLLVGGGALVAALTGNRVLQSVLNAAGQGIGSVLVDGFAAAIMAVLYYELRARNEGFDLAQRGLQISGWQADAEQRSSGNV